MYGYLVYLQYTNFVSYLDALGVSEEDLREKVDLIVSQAESSFDSGNNQESWSLYGDAQELYMKYNRIHMSRGKKLMTLGRLDEARANFNEAHSINPDDFLTNMLLAETYFRMNRISFALDYFQVAHRLDPDDAETTGWIAKIQALQRIDNAYFKQSPKTSYTY